LHEQRSPQVHRAAAGAPQPHEVFSHAHTFWLVFVIDLLLVLTR
jgi:hypothetical protein